MKSRIEEIRNWLRYKPVRQAFQPAIHYPELREFTKADLKAVSQYKRRLPHWELEGSTYFITFHVSDGVVNTFPLLDVKNVGQAFQPAFPPASIVEESIWFVYGERYIMDAYVIMPDHVHLLITPLQGWRLGSILKGIKGYTAREINKVLDRKGPYWQDENFDHLIRNEADWLDKFNYIHDNPVRAELVERPEDYPFSSLVTLHSEGRLESLPHILEL